MKIDAFLYNDEYDLLEIRLKENWDYFDKFILIEGDRYFNGKKRESIKNSDFFKKKFEWEQKKLSVHISKNLENIKTGFENEEIQINLGEKIIKSYGKYSEVCWGAVDEIPKVTTVNNYFKSELGMAVLKQYFFYYYLNGKINNQNWNGTLIFRTIDLDKICLNELVKKRSFELKTIDDGGWHFSYLGGVEKIIEKINTFAHQELNLKQFKDKKKIQDVVKKGKDIFFREKDDPLLMGNDPIEIKYIPVDGTFPNYIIKNKIKFRKLIKFDLFNTIDVFFKRFNINMFNNIKK